MNVCVTSPLEWGWLGRDAKWCDVMSLHNFGEGQMFRVLVVTSACLASHWVMLYDAQWHVNVLRVVSYSSPTHYHQLSEGQGKYHNSLPFCVCVMSSMECGWLGLWCKVMQYDVTLWLLANEFFSGHITIQVCLANSVDWDWVMLIWCPG